MMGQTPNKLGSENLPSSHSVSTVRPRILLGKSTVRHGLTLTELLVALTLSLLLLTVLLPLLRQTLAIPTQPSTGLEPAWSQVLNADVRELVSPSKCALPVVQRLAGPSSADFEQLKIQTYNRIGASENRGPTEVRYTLELVEGQLALIRTAQGWHDNFSSRQVLARHLSGWSLSWADVHAKPAAPANGQTESLVTPDPAEVIRTSSVTPAHLQHGMLLVTLTGLDGQQIKQSFWIGLPEGAGTSTQPADATTPAQELTP